MFNGPEPFILVAESQEAEEQEVANWLQARAGEGIIADEIAVFVRSQAEIPRAQAAVKSTALPFVILDEKIVIKPGHVSICTMHLAKGLEFRAVAVMACDDEIIPSLKGASRRSPTLPT